ncbi:hypothetical protein ABVT39_009446 [Epinephelus coioides]
MKLIVAALYLARQEQAFRGHNEATSSSNRGNFVELVHAFVEFDTTLAEHLGSSTVFSGMSNTIQNDIVESIARVIQDETDKEINMSPFIAVQVDDTSDISNKCQLTVIIRYGNEKGSVCVFSAFLIPFLVSQNHSSRFCKVRRWTSKKCQDRIKGTLSTLKATGTDVTFSGIYDETVQAVGEPVPRRKRCCRGWEDLEQGVNQHQEGDEEIVAIPAISTSAERSFSCLKRIKTYLRDTCGQDRLVNLAKISIDSVVVEDLKASGKFYDIVIDHFATKKDRRMAFLFK